ncbi:hypothetical protein [Rubripirellula tenax]|nr:hypothetical protein [Rubripirellula tenax]
MAATVVKDPVQFVPLMLGIPILFCGVVALNPHRRKIAMNLAAVIGSVGTVIGLLQAIVWGVRWSDAGPVSEIGGKIIAAMTWLCATFVVICVIALVRDRRRRNSTHDGGDKKSGSTVANRLVSPATGLPGDGSHEARKIGEPATALEHHEMNQPEPVFSRGRS